MVTGLAQIIGHIDMDSYARAEGPTSILPISYWYPKWWGISPWASPFWIASRV